MNLFLYLSCYLWLTECVYIIINNSGHFKCHKDICILLFCFNMTFCTCPNVNYWSPLKPSISWDLCNWSNSAVLSSRLTTHMFLAKYYVYNTFSGYGRFHYSLLLLCGWALSSDAIEVLSISFVLPAATCDLQLTSTDKGWLTAVIFIGKLIFCIHVFV